MKVHTMDMRILKVYTYHKYYMLAWVLLVTIIEVRLVVERIHNSMGQPSMRYYTDSSKKRGCKSVRKMKLEF
jgi:hypothetical protein